MENVKFYESPELHHLDAESEGVLCQSGGDIDVPGFNKGDNLDDLFY